MAKKIKLSYINGGKEFTLPDMTVERQEQMMEEMIDIKYKPDDEKYTREVNKRIVLVALHSIDKSFTLEDVNIMHPEDFVVVLGEIWDAGRELKKSDAKDFRRRK